jgi:hypothetical protein
MQPEDRLDAWLARRKDAQTPQEGPPDMDGLTPLLEAVDRLEPLRQATPRAAFAASLEVRLLARAAELQTGGQAALDGHTLLNDFTAPILPRADDSPTLPSVLALPSEEQTEPLATSQDGSAGGPWPVPLRALRGRQTRHFGSRVPVRAWQTVAAALLLIVIGGGLFAAVVSAAPGSPLFGLRRWGQDVRITLDTSAAGRTGQHLQLADQYLADLEAVIAQYQGDTAYSDALSALRQEDRAAVSDLAAVTEAGAVRDLQSRLADLHQRERRDLRDALLVIGWSNRVLTTQALGELGETVPVVASATVEGEIESGVQQWRIRLTGTGFQQGAQLMLNGQPFGGAVLEPSPTTLEVVWPDAGTSRISGRLGVQNPDGTAAETSNIRQHDQSGDDDSATPTSSSGDGHHGGSGGSTSTPGSDDHGGGSGGKSSFSPTSSPKPSSGDDAGGGGGGGGGG